MRGKYKKRATLRQGKQLRSDEQAARNRVAEELRKQRQTEQQAVELDKVLADIEKLRDALAEATKDEVDALTQEIAQLTSQLLTAVDKADKQRRQRDKKVVRTGGGWTEGVKTKHKIAHLEYLANQRQAKEGKPGFVWTAGVHVGKGLDLEAIKRIQRARGLRD